MQTATSRPRPLALAILAGACALAPCPDARAAPTRAGSPPAPRAITASLALGPGQTRVVAASAALGRVLVSGAGRPPYLSVVDTTAAPRLRELAHLPMASDALAALDEARARAYVVTTAPLEPPAVALLSLRTGHQVAAGGAAMPNPERVAVDPASGNLVAVGPASLNGPQVVSVVGPGGRVLRQRTLAGTDASHPRALLLDPAHRLLVLALADVPAASDYHTTLVALDAATLAPRWARTLGYPTDGNGGFLAQDPGAGQLWAVAPGGLVEAIDAGTGRVRSSFARRGGVTPPGTQLALLVDGVRHRGYVALWGYRVDVFDPATRDRHELPEAACTGAELVGLDQRAGVLLTERYAGVSLCDARTGAAVGGFALDRWDGSAYPATLAEAAGTLLLARDTQLPVDDPVAGSTTEGGVTLAIVR